MARGDLRLLLIAPALLSGACDRSPQADAQGSITVELPPARPVTPRPRFSLKAPNQMGTIKVQSVEANADRHE
jgi:hypothetical protein